MHEDLLSALKDVIDPEVGINIVDLGLVYRVAWTQEGIAVDLTMTTPSCPLGEMLVTEAEQVLRHRFEEASAVRVSLVWDPPWSPERMSDEARRQLGWSPPSRGSRATQ